MKIGLVLSTTPSYSETFFISKIKGLQANGHEVVLFVQKKKPDFRLCEVRELPKLKSFSILPTIISFVFNHFIYFNRIVKYYAIEKEEGNSFKGIIKKIFLNQHILFYKKLNWLHFGFATLAIGRENLAKSLNAKMAISFRGYDIDVYPLKHRNCYLKLWNKVDKVHSISNYLYQKAIDLGLAVEKDHQIIHPAIDTKDLPKIDSTNNIEIRLITIGRLHWIKNYIDILKALKILKEKGVNFIYTIVGYGVLDEALKYYVYENDLKNNVVFKGNLSHERTLKELLKSNIYIQYSHSEGFCNAVLEAQYARLLSIVADVGGMSENIIHKKTGWVVPKYHPEKLAVQIEKVINLSHEEKNKITTFASDRVKKEFNIQKQQEEFINFYTS